MRLSVCLIFLWYSALSAGAFGKGLVPWGSPQSEKRLGRSEYWTDFAGLSNQFQNQMDGMSCGPVTGAIVLNALRLGGKKDLPQTTFSEAYKKYLPKGYDPRIRRYTPENFMAGKAHQVKTLSQLYGRPVKGVKDFGLQVRQLNQIFLLHGVNSQLRIVDKELSARQVKLEWTSNLKKKGDYVVINYDRSALGQKGGGHISPLGAYDEKTDSFLIMDVNSGKYPWVWVKTADLIRALRTFDTVENRGYLLIEESS